MPGSKDHDDGELEDLEELEEIWVPGEYDGTSGNREIPTHLNLPALRRLAHRVRLLEEAIAWWEEDPSMMLGEFDGENPSFKTLILSALATGAGGSGSYLPLAGGTMSGAIAMGANKVTGLANGTAAQDAAAFGQIPVLSTFPNFVESGCIWTADAPNSTLNGSMTAGVVWIGGKRLTVAAITAHAFTASKDTYIDLQDGGSGSATVTYQTANNGGAAAALTGTTANTLRLGMVPTHNNGIVSAIIDNWLINQGNPSILSNNNVNNHVGALSNGHSLSNATLNINSTTGFSGSGIVGVRTSSGLGIITYTGTSGGNALTGCVCIFGVNTSGAIVSGATAGAWTTVGSASGDIVLQLTASIAVSDSAGNLLYPTFGQSLIGVRYLTNDANNNSATPAAVSALSCPVLVPAGRRVKVTFSCRDVYNTTAGGAVVITIWDGTVGSGFKLKECYSESETASGQHPLDAFGFQAPSSGLHTYNVGLANGAGATVAHIDAGLRFDSTIGTAASISVELV